MNEFEDHEIKVFHFLLSHQDYEIWSSVRYTKLL
jgi:hypothetical protein